MGSTLEAVYADGWDRGVVNPLTRAVAEARDAAGEPYTVVLLFPSGPAGLEEDDDDLPRRKHPLLRQHIDRTRERGAVRAGAPAATYGRKVRR